MTFFSEETSKSVSITNSIRTIFSKRFYENEIIKIVSCENKRGPKLRGSVKDSKLSSKDDWKKLLRL